LQSLLRPAPFSPALASLSPSYILPLISQKAQTLLDFFDKLRGRFRGLFISVISFPREWTRAKSSGIA
ncbi:MAG: hypothetical protein AAGU74_04060, partial [Bacillota bacterium]